MREGRDRRPEVSYSRWRQGEISFFFGIFPLPFLPAIVIIMFTGLVSGRARQLTIGGEKWQ